MVKTSLLTAVLMTSALLQSTEVKAVAFDPFADVPRVQSQAIQDIYSGLKFHYYDRRDRLMILNAFLTSVELEYALLPLKEKRIGLDFEKLKEEARDAEIAAGEYTLSAADRKDNDAKEKIAYYQAASNMEFLDRMQALVAKFKDTHFNLSETISRPFMYNGLRFARADGKVVISAIDKRLIAMVAKLSNTDFTGLNVGEAVVSIDGVKVEDKVNELKPYIAGSTDEYIDIEAVRQLTFRNFKYDKKNFVRVGLASGKVFKVPYFINSSVAKSSRADVMTYANKHQIPSDVSTLGISFDNTTGKWVDNGTLNFDGYSIRNLKENLKGVVEMLDDGGSPAIRTGYYINKGKVYAVMQLMTFSTKNVKVGEKAVPFLDAIRAFALDAKNNDLKVILDLRANNGGNGNFPAAVLGIFTQAGKKNIGPSFGYRVTPYIRTLEEQENYQHMAAEDQSEGLTYDDIRQIIDMSIDEERVFAPMYSQFGNIGPDSKVGGFEQDIAVLVTPYCISACDMTAALFKASKRATIIGTTSNGTGAGYRSSSVMNTKWQDPLRVLTTNIPNFLFGRPGTDPEQKVYGDNSVDELCSENQPAIADISYRNAQIDIMKGNLGWLQKAAQVLESGK